MAIDAVVCAANTLLGGVALIFCCVFQRRFELKKVEISNDNVVIKDKSRICNYIQFKKEFP